jgi:hypothetical protein
MNLKVYAAMGIAPIVLFGIASGVNLIRPLESESEAKATAMQTVQSIRFEGRPVSGWSIDASRFDAAPVISDSGGHSVQNCLGGGLPGVCIADPVWRFHFVAVPQGGYAIEASVAVDARSRHTVGECDAAVSVGSDNLPFKADWCSLSQPFGD